MVKMARTAGREEAEERVEMASKDAQRPPDVSHDASLHPGAGEMAARVAPEEMQARVGTEGTYSSVGPHRYWKAWNGT